MTKADIDRAREFNKENYDRVVVFLPKGQKDDLKFHAKCMGESLNSFIKRAIQKQLEEDDKA